MDNTGGGSNTFYVKVNGNTYTWEIVLNNGYNPPEFVKDGNNVNAAPVNVTLSGKVSIVLAVREDGAKIDKLALVPVDVEPQNQPPTADAGADQTVTAANTNNAAQVTLDGTGSTDTDGTIVSYAWSANGGEFATEATPTYVFGVGTTEVTLTVTDDDGATATDTVSITVSPFVADNQPPMADAGADQTVEDTDGNGIETITLDGSASTDSDGIIVSYAWNATGVTIPDGATPSADFPVGTTEVTLTVTDDDGATAADTVMVTVTEPQTGGDECSTTLVQEAEDATLSGAVQVGTEGGVTYAGAPNGTVSGTGTRTATTTSSSASRTSHPEHTNCKVGWTTPAAAATPST